MNFFLNRQRLVFHLKFFDDSAIPYYLRSVDIFLNHWRVCLALHSYQLLLMFGGGNMEYPDYPKMVRGEDITWCCKFLEFLVSNQVAEPQVESLMMSRHGDGLELEIGMLKGVRMRHKFAVYPRGKVYYECPFCRADLVRILDFFATKPVSGYWPIRNVIEPGPDTRPGGGLEYFEIPMSAFEEALKDARERSRHMREVRRQGRKAPD